ncbi:MAG: stage II sporulation protein R [Oscillospiraceae bacterium]|nr:stage II sporulation protein R [Oscillospiraceae bacterium]
MNKRIKIWELSLLIALCITLCQAAIDSGRQESLSEKVLRMHVVAASDSEADQALKLKVRDAAVREVEAALEGCEDIYEARMAIKLNEKAILAAARDAAEGERVTMSLNRESFSHRVGEGYSLPAGEYWALRLSIGEGRGHNWWGLIFPAFEDAECYVPAADYLSDEEMRLIIDGGETEIRFRFLEIWEKIREMMGRR